MNDTSLQRLLAELPLTAQNTALLQALPDDARARLVQVLLDAIEKKDARINGAVNNALTVVPLPLRGTVKKMLFS